MRPNLDAVIDDMEAMGIVTPAEAKEIAGIDGKVASAQFKLRMTSHILSKEWKMLDFIQTVEYREAKNNLVKSLGVLGADQVLEQWFHAYQSLFV